MNNFSKLIVLGGILAFQACDQGYKVGSASVSIEPENSVYSLTLSGYGYPPEGRFSIDWKDMLEVGKVKWMSGNDESLFYINQNNVMYRVSEPSANPVISKMESDFPLKCFAVSGDSIYGITCDGEWGRGKISRNKVRWNIMDSPLSNVVAITQCSGRLYAITVNEELYEGIIDDDSVTWQKIGSGESVIGLTAHNNRLIALTSNQKLWKLQLNLDHPEWICIGYNNGCTYNIDLEQVATADGSLFSIGMDGRLYKSYHRSDNNMTARSMAIQKGKETVIIASLDVTGFDRDFYDGICDEVESSLGIPAQNILLNASHTHFAPCAQGLPAWHKPNQEPDSIYLNNVVRPAVIKAIKESVKTKKNSNLEFVRTESVIGSNRCLGGEDATLDSAVDIVKVTDRKGSLRKLIFTAACHPVFSNSGETAFTLSGNYPSVAKTILEETLNLDHATFLQGCAGDTNPISGDFRETAAVLSEDVADACMKDSEKISGEITARIDTLWVPFTPWPEDKILEFRDTYVRYNGVEEAKNVRWADLMLKMYKEGTMYNKTPIFIQTVQIGNWKIIAFSREVVSRYSLRIRELFPQENVTVIAYTGDVVSYVPAASHIRAHTYEGENSFVWYGKPYTTMPESIEDTIINKIKTINR